MPAAPAETPRDTLKKRQEALKAAETAAKTASDSVTALRGEVAELTRAVGDVDQALTGYDKTLSRLQSQRDDLNLQMTGFDATLGTLVRPKLSEITAAIQHYADDAAAAQQHAADLRTASVKARDAADAAAQKETAADDRLKAAKQHLHTAESSLSDLAGLLKQVQQATNDRNYAGAYFLLTEAQRIKVDVRDRAAQKRVLPRPPRRRRRSRAAAPARTARDAGGPRSRPRSGGDEPAHHAVAVLKPSPFRRPPRQRNPLRPRPRRRSSGADRRVMLSAAPDAAVVIASQWPTTPRSPA